MNNEKYTLASLPLRGQRYFYVTWDKKRGVIVISRVFSADAFDYRAVKSEVAFKTAEAAEREKYNVYTALTGKEWER
ncbi:MAG: hypothetical protein MRZ66_05935 [Clostridiales bacterium]|nr:hypothetical protein [Clostridiales bacterium]